MNLPPPPNPDHPGFDETLRLIARLPAPQGLEERVLDRLAAVPRGRVLAWPRGRQWMQSQLARGAAAAAIVCVVTGGGWAVYSRVTPPPAAKVAVLPVPAAPRGFSSANAVRTPKTLEGPALHGEEAQPSTPPDHARPGKRPRHRKNAGAAHTAAP